MVNEGLYYKSFQIHKDEVTCIVFFNPKDTHINVDLDDNKQDANDSMLMVSSGQNGILAVTSIREQLVIYKL